MVKLRFEQLNANPRARDAVVAAIWMLLGLALIQFGAIRLWSAAAIFQSSDSVFLVLLFAMVAVSTQRSSRPQGALGLGSIIAAIDVLFGGSLGVILVFTDLIYASFKYGSDRGVRVILCIIAGLAVVTAAILLIWQPNNLNVQIVAAQVSVVIFMAAMWGWNVRSERLRTSASMAEEYTKSTQKLRRLIAHDLHDLVANQIAVAGLHVEAAKLQAIREGVLSRVSEHSLDQAAFGTRLADQQLRRMIQVLHTVDDLSEPSDASLEQFVDESLRSLEIRVPGDRSIVWLGAGSAGLTTGLTVTSPAQARVVMRVLQELIANAVKHGQGDIAITIEDIDGLSITVTNDVSTGQPANSGSGIGIAGATMLIEGTGATLESAPIEDGRRWMAEIHSPTRKE